MVAVPPRKPGQGLVELALLLALLAIVTVGVLAVTGRQVSTVFGQVNSGLTHSAVANPPPEPTAAVSADPGGSSNSPGNTGSTPAAPNVNPPPGEACATGNACDSNAGGNGNGNAGGNGNGNAGGNGNGNAGGNGNGHH